MSVGQGLCIYSYFHLFHHNYDKTIFRSIVKCPTNILIDNGYLKLNENGASVSYQCTDGYRLVGSASATCKEDGTWSSPPPKCAGMILSVANTYLVA